MSEVSVTLFEGAPAGVKVVGLIGEMDEPSLDVIRPKLEPVLNDATLQYVVFDLKDLSYINSKGIGYLVSVHTHLSKLGRRLFLCAAQEAVMDVINLVGLTAIIPHYEKLEEALGAAQK